MVLKYHQLPPVLALDPHWKSHCMSKECNDKEWQKWQYLIVFRFTPLFPGNQWLCMTQVSVSPQYNMEFWTSRTSSAVNLSIITCPTYSLAWSCPAAYISLKLITSPITSSIIHWQLVDSSVCDMMTTMLTIGIYLNLWTPRACRSCGQPCCAVVLHFYGLHLRTGKHQTIDR